MEPEQTNQTPPTSGEAQTANPPATAPQPVPAAAPPLLNVPQAEWPGAAGAYKYSKQAVKRNWAVILCLLLIAFIVPAILKPAIGISGSLVGQLFSLWIEAVLVFVYFASVRGQKVSFSNAFAKVKFLPYVKFVVNSFLVGLILFGSVLALIIPFFFIMPRVIFAPYLVLDKDLDPIEAISTSWAMTKGQAGKIWGIIGLTIAMALLFITIIGIPFALYLMFMYAGALFVLYEFIGKTKAAEPVPAAPAPTAPVPATPATSTQTASPTPAVPPSDSEQPPANTPPSNPVQ